MKIPLSHVKSHTDFLSPDYISFIPLLLVRPTDLFGPLTEGNVLTSPEESRKGVENGNSVSRGGS